MTQKTARVTKRKFPLPIQTLNDLIEMTYER